MFPTPKQWASGRLGTSNLPVNSHLAVRVRDTLRIMGVRNTDREIRRWSTKCFHSITLFIQACHKQNLNSCWGCKQKAAYLDLLHQIYYSTSTLDAYWNLFKKVGHLIGASMTTQGEIDFVLVKEDAKELKDDRLSVSKALLRQLITEAVSVLDVYNCTLAKALFICPWNFSMCISDFSVTKATSLFAPRTHNIHKATVRSTDNGVSIQFMSDKTTHYSKAIKHRKVMWQNLPSGSKAIINRYIASRPEGAQYFFCQNDGRPLT